MVRSTSFCLYTNRLYSDRLGARNGLWGSFRRKCAEEKDAQINLNAKVLEIRESPILYEQDGEEKEYDPIANVVQEGCRIRKTI